MIRQVIRWGILGAGRIAGQFVEGLRAVPDAEVAAVGSRTAAGAEAFGDRHGIPRRHAGYQALADDPEVDVVYVAVPHSGHHAETLRCLRAGKAVLCEKPFALNAAQAAEMVATARERGLFLMEAMWTRYLPAVVRIRELLAEGAIGDPRLLVTDLGWRFPADPASRLYAPELGGGALLDLGVYGVSFASMLFGPPVSVTAAGSLTATGVDAQTAVATVHDGGRLATAVCTLEAATTPLATITGTEGRIDIRHWFNPAGFTLTAGDGPATTFEYPPDGNGMEYEAREVQRCLAAGLPESPVTPLDETLRIMATLDQVRSLLGVRYPGEIRRDDQPSVRTLAVSPDEPDEEVVMSDPTHEERLREIARERERHMPGETAGGRIDPSTLPEDEREELARRAPQLDPEDEELGGEG